MRPGVRLAAVVLSALAVAPLVISGLAPPRAGPQFAAEVARLSEPGGYFDTDNLISNERSYLDVIPALEASSARGGAYLGVGPDTNFSYIVRVRPEVAYIIDIRRDNLLLHLLLKALFSEAPTRIEYLSLLTGRAPPSAPATWAAASVADLVAHVERERPAAAGVKAIHGRLEAVIAGFGVPLSRADSDTIRRFHQAFIDEGLGLTFRSHGRPARYYYPTLKALLLATDPLGRRRHYLASEDDYQFLRTLQLRDAVIPVVGNVGGEHALKAIGEAVADRGLRVSAFYISNVEYYLFRSSYERFLENIKRLPRSPQGVMIRSTFGGGPSSSALQTIAELVQER